MGVAGWSIGNGWCTLLVPVMFDKIKENALYIFGCANILAIVVVWAFYPETANVRLALAHSVSCERGARGATRRPLPLTNR